MDFNANKFKKAGEIVSPFSPYIDPSAEEGWSPSLRSSFPRYRNQVIGPMGFQSGPVQDYVSAGSSFDTHLTSMLRALENAGGLESLGISRAFIQTNGTVMINGVPVTTTNDTIFVIGGKTFVLDEKLTNKHDPSKPEYTTQLVSQSVLAQGKLLSGSSVAPSLGNTDLSQVVAGTVNIDVGRGPALLMDAERRAAAVEKRYLDQGYEREEAHAASHSERIGIYADAINRLIVQPATSYAQTGKSQTMGATTIVPHNVASPEAKALAVSEVTESQALLRAVVKISGIRPQDLPAYMSNLRSEKMTEVEWLKNQQWVETVSQFAHEAVRKGAAVTEGDYANYQARANAVIGGTRRFFEFTDRHVTKRVYNPHRDQAGISATVLMDDQLGAIDLGLGQWRRIGNTQAYHNGTEIAFLSKSRDALGYNVVAHRTRFSMQGNGVMAINGRIISGGEEEVNLIAEQTITAFERGGGGRQGAQYSGAAFTRMMNGRHFEAMSSITEQMRVKSANSVRVTGGGSCDPIQSIMQRVMQGNVPIFFRDGQTEGYKAIPVIQATPGAFVANPQLGHGATAYVGRGVTKWNKDLQKAARDYRLAAEGRQFKSPIRMLGADAPEELTRLDTAYSNMLEYSKLDTGLANYWKSNNQISSAMTLRIPYIASDNFVPVDNVGEVLFDKETRKLRIGKGDDANNFYNLENWQDFAASNIRTERIGGKNFLVIDGSAFFDPVKEQMKNWLGDKGMAVAGGLFGLESKGVEYLSVQGDNLRQNAYKFLSSYYAHEGGGAEGMRTDLMSMLDSPTLVKNILEWGAVVDPATGTKAASVDELRAILTSDMGSTRLKSDGMNVPDDDFVWGGSKNIDNALFFLASDKAKQFTTTETMEVPMSRAGYEYYASLLGQYSRDRGVGVHAVDVEARFGSDPFAMKPIKVTQNMFHHGNMGHQFSQAWAHGQAQLSLEEMVNIARNQGNLSDDAHRAIMEKAMPGWMAHGKRDRVNSEAILNTHLLNRGVASGDIGLGGKVMEFSDFERELRDFTLEKGLDIKGDFFRVLNDEAFLNKVKGKYIHMSPEAMGGEEAYMMPADIMRNLAHYQAGEKVVVNSIETGFGPNAHIPDYNGAGINNQSVRLLNLFRKTILQGDTSGKWDFNLTDIRSEVDIMATGKSTRKKAFSSQVGREGIYVFDDRLPDGTVIMGRDTLRAWFGTDNYDEATALMREGNSLFSMIHRRPDSNSAMSANTPARILPPGSLPDIPDSSDVMVVSGTFRDQFQGDSDGDRMHAMLVAMNQNINKMFDANGEMAGLFNAGGSDDALARLSAGFSALTGTKVKFNSRQDYWDFAQTLYCTNRGVNMTEWGKRAADVIKSGKSDWENGFLPGSKAAFDRFNTAGTLSEGERQFMTAEGIAKKQMAESYNIFIRRLMASGEMMGYKDQAFTEHAGRFSYYTYQTGLDKELYSSGLREMIGMVTNYDPSKSEYKDFMQDKIGDITAMSGVQTTGHSSFSAPIALIASVLGSHELRGGGKNLNWLNDVARSLSNDSGMQAKIAEMLVNRVDGATMYTLGHDGTSFGVSSSIAMNAETEDEIKSALNDKKFRVDLARDIYREVFGGEDANFMKAGGSISDLFYSGLIERASRGRDGRVSDGAQSALARLGMLDQDTFDRLLASGKTQRANLNLLGDGDGNTADDMAALRKYGGADALFGELSGSVSPDLIQWLRTGMKVQAHSESTNPFKAEFPFAFKDGKIHTMNGDEIEVIEQLKSFGVDMAHVSEWLASGGTVGAVAGRAARVSTITPQTFAGGASFGTKLEDLTDEQRNTLLGSVVASVQDFFSKQVASSFAVNPTETMNAIQSQMGPGNIAKWQSMLGNIRSGAGATPTPPAVPVQPPSQFTSPVSSQAKVAAGLPMNQQIVMKVSNNGNGGLNVASYAQDVDPGSKYGAMFAHPDARYQFADGTNAPTMNEVAAAYRQSPRAAEQMLVRLQDQMVTAPGVDDPISLLTGSGSDLLSSTFTGKRKSSALGFFNRNSMQDTAEWYRATTDEFDQRGGIGLTGDLLDGFTRTGQLSYDVGGSQFNVESLSDVMALLGNNAIGKPDAAAMSKIVRGKGSLDSYVMSGVSEGWMSPEVGAKLMESFAAKVDKAGMASEHATKGFEEFAEAFKKNGGGWRQSIDDMREALTDGSTLSQNARTRADYNKSSLVRLASMADADKDTQGEMYRGMRKAGLSRDEMKEVVAMAAAAKSVLSDEDMAMANNGQASLKKPSGLGGAATRFFEGDLGQLGWGLMNMGRIWRMTGGQVQDHMSAYAEYAGQQQQSMMAMGGTQGYSGPVADVIAQQNAVRKFGLGMGKAGWDIFGGIAKAIGASGDGIDVDKPTGGMYLATGAMGVGGVALTGALAKNLATKILGKDFMTDILANAMGSELEGGAAAEMVKNAGAGGVLRGVGSNILHPNFSGLSALGVAGSVAGGIAIGTTMAYDINKSGFLGTGIGQDSKMANADFGTYMKTRLTDLSSLSPDVILALAGDKGAASRVVAERDAKRKAVGLNTEQTDAEKQYDAYSTWGKNLEGKVKTLSAGEGLQVGALIAKTTGISDGVLTGGNATVDALATMIARQGTSPEVQQKLSFGAQLARGAGYQYGSVGMAGYINNNMMQVTPDQMMRAQEAYQNVQPLVNFAQQTGVGLNLTPAMLDSLSKGDQWSMAQLGRGDQRTWSDLSRMQLSQGRGALGDRMTAMGLTGVARGLKLPTTDDIRRGITLESNNLPVMSTRESIDNGYFSRSDYDKAMAQNGFNQPGAYNYNPAFSNVRDIASITNDKRNLERAYQAQQYAFQAQSWNRQNVFNLGGISENGTQVMGQFALQGASIGEGMRNTNAMNALQAGSLNFGWQGSNLATLQGNSLGQLGQSGLQYRQFYEDMANQRKSVDDQRQWSMRDAYTSFNRGNTQLNWSQNDLQTSFSRNMTQFSQAVQDLTTNFARNQTTTQWSSQALAVQGNQLSMNFGWQMDDLEESMRYATGRDRRKIAKQMERGTIEYAQGVSQLDTEKAHLDERAKWAEEDFAKEQARIEQKRKWADEDFNKDQDRIDTQRGWLDEDLARALDRLNAQSAVEDEQWKLKIQHYEEDVKMQSLLHAESVKHAEIMNGISAQSLAENLLQFKENQAQAETERTRAQAYATRMNGLSDELDTTLTMANNKVKDFAFDFGDPNGALARGLSDFALNVRKELLDTHNANSVLSSYETLTQKIVESMKAVIQGLN